MTEVSELRQQLQMATAMLNVLETTKAGYPLTEVPPTLMLNLQEKRNEVESLKTRIGQLEGKSVQKIPHNLPRRNFFVGRVVEVNTCITTLSPKERSWGVMIDGIGGMGKTALAVEVAYRVQEQAMFDAYLFFSAKTTWLTPEGIQEEKLVLSSLDAFVREFALELGYDEISRETNANERTRKFLAQIHGRTTLSIWDNLETVPPDERYKILEFLRELPAPNKAIVTSRRRTGESAITIRLDQMTEQDATALIRDLMKQYPRVKSEMDKAQPNTLQDLYNTSGGNPLVLRQVLGLMDQRGYSLAQAVTLLREGDHSGDIYAFLFADAVRDLAPNEKAVLSALASQNSTTVGILKVATGFTTSEVQTAVDRLIVLSLVNDPIEERYSLHTLTRSYIQRILGVRHPDPSSILDKVQLDPDVNRKMLSYWVKYTTDNKNAPKKLKQEWSNIEAAATALHKLIAQSSGLDNEANQLLIDLAITMCRESGPLFSWGYWDETVKLGTWGYEAAVAINTWTNACLLAQYIVSIHYRREESEQANIWNERLRNAYRGSGQSGSLSSVIIDLTSAISTVLEANMLISQGQLLMLAGDNDAANELLTKAIGLCQQSNFEEGQANALFHLGRIAHRSQSWDKAREYYNQGMMIAEHVDNKLLDAQFSNALGDLAMGRPELGELFHWLSDIVGSKDKPMWQRVLAGVGWVGSLAAKAYFESKSTPTQSKSVDITSAKPYYEHAMTLAQENDIITELANAQRGLAEIKEQENKYNEALALAEKARNIYRQLRDPKRKETERLVIRLREQVKLEEAESQI